MEGRTSITVTKLSPTSQLNNRANGHEINHNEQVKILQVILVGSLSIAAISACGGEDSASSSSTSAAAETMVVDEATTVVEATEAPAPDVPANSALPALGECPTSIFPDLTAVTGPGEEYAMPEVNVECTDTEIVVTSNGMPSYTFESMTPNGLEEQTWEWRIPLKPTLAANTTSIVNVLGTLGFTTTGLPIYGPTEGPTPTREAFGDPIYNGLLDTCGGHTGYAADYHNHALNIDVYCNLTSSVIVGYALDGFPIYNSVGCLNVDCTETAEFVSGYDMTGDPTSYSWNAYTYNASGKTNVLDECNGRTGPDGTYRYHATGEFPYIIGCFAGTSTTQTGNAAADMPPMGGNGGNPPPNGNGPPPNG